MIQEKISALLFLLMIAIFTGTPAASAVTVSGQLLCDGSPHYIYGAVSAFDAADFSTLDTAFVDSSDHYHLTVPENTEMIIVAFAGSEKQLEGYDLAQYMPIMRAIAVASDDIDLDLTTEPTYQILLIGTKDSRILTSDEYPVLFSVDEQDEALATISMEAENQSTSLKVPSINIPLGKTTAIYLQWELPHAGRIMVRIDNQGEGYGSDQQGALILQVNEALAESSLARLERAIDETSVDVADAEAALDQAETAYNDGDFDEAAGLAITAVEDLALLEAEEGIEKYRKGELTVTVVDKNGTPVPDANVSALQQSRDFRFGVFDNFSDLDESIWSQALDDGFNFFTAGFYWTESEPENNDYAWDKLDHSIGILDMHNLGYNIKGHPLVWLMPLLMPDYLKEMDFDSLYAEVQEHVAAMVGRYSDQISIWDVVNEAHGAPASAGFTREQTNALTKAAVDMVRATDPEASVVINSCFDWFGQSKVYDLFEIGRNETYGLSIPAYIQQLLDYGVEIDVIGQQMYNGGCVTFFEDIGVGEADGVPTYDMAEIADILEKLADFDRPVHITEQSVASSMDDRCESEGYWRNHWSEEAQADFVESFYTIGFGSPAVQAMTWWNLGASYPFVSGGNLIDENGDPRPAYNRLKSLFAKWTTEATDQTDSQGQVTISAFAGDYSIAATIDGHTAETTDHVFEGESLEITLTLEDYEVPPDEADDSGDDDDNDDDQGCGC